MEIVVLEMLCVVSVWAQFGKHVYVAQEFSWPEAQRFCRDHYTDLSPITSRREEVRLKNATTGRVREFWIGLNREAGGPWKWSGGGDATYPRWDEEEPDENQDHVFGSVCWDGCERNGWHKAGPGRKLPFLCFNLMLMEQRRSWEEAWRHCRRRHTALTDLASETEHLLALSEIQQDGVTERVWIGLRFLGDRWLWVDGSPLVFQAWPQGGDQDHQCPAWKRCGALTKEGVWENWDCQDNLNFLCY